MWKEIVEGAIVYGKEGVEGAKKVYKGQKYTYIHNQEGVENWKKNSKILWDVTLGDRY